MKFCLKQKIIKNPPSTDSIEKVSGVAEYEALRAEKLFRYEYSNQLNTSLLTFAFVVYTAGFALFSFLADSNSLSNTMKLFVEFFFSVVFLLPCIFSKINFRYTVQNSLRIGQLTDYIREKVKFDDDESWESFKRDYHVNYFYRQPTGVGGAKEIPFWIDIISLVMSLIVAYMNIENYLYLINDNNEIESYVVVGFVCAIGLIVICSLLHTIIRKNCVEYHPTVVCCIFVFIQVIAYIIFILYINSLKCTFELDFWIMFSIWLLSFNWCLSFLPRYNREIEIANSVLDYTKAKLVYSSNNKKCNRCPNPKRNEIIFKEFLKSSTIVERYLHKKRGVNKCKCIFKKIDVCEKDLSIDKRNYLISKFFEENNLR
ncbi:MAG: hypothetical protein IJY27_07055 [Clostridia bacterium]|nr:hypothetical protein [Clostridia bacterium]